MTEDEQNGLPPPPEMAPRTNPENIYPGFFYNRDYQGNKYATWKAIGLTVGALVFVGYLIGRR